MTSDILRSSDEERHPQMNLPIGVSHGKNEPKLNAAKKKPA